MRKLHELLATSALVLACVSRAHAAPILVGADATVAGGLFADVNFGTSTNRGGLLSGSEGSAIFGPYRFYLMFTLPTFVPNTVIASATLQGFYNDDWDAFDDRTHSLYQAPSTWSESTITWNNQPGAVGAAFGMFNAATATPGNFYSWDVTSALNATYLAQSSLFSVLFRADNEALGVTPLVNNNLEFFASRELLGGARAFQIDLEIGAVPEPSTVLLVSSGLAGTLAFQKRRRRSARS
jgi:PEP-CTERM motif